MAPRLPRGVSGLAVVTTAAGMVLIYAAVANATVSDTVRALLKGQKPPSRPSSLDAARTSIGQRLGQAVAGEKGKGSNATEGIGTATGKGSAPATSLGQQIAAYAAGHLGKPYVFGAEGPDAFDCSGLVTYVLHKECGLTLPSNVHTVTGQFYVWKGADTVSRPPVAGDLICWTGHIGIAIDSETMIHAPGAGQKVKTTRIYYTGSPLVRRVRPQ
jgi:cell wall-associated NlpC family hydrolase